MDKQMIEEMSKIYCQNGFKCEENCQTNGCRVYEICTELYNAGYRKIPEGAVALTEEEYERWQGQTLNIKKVRKETAEKFAERLKEYSITEYKEFGALRFYKISYPQLDELVEEMTK